MKTVLLCGVRKHVNARLRDGFMVLNGNLSLKNKQSAMKMGIRANGNLVSIFKNKPLNGIPFARERTVASQRADGKQKKKRKRKRTPGAAKTKYSFDFGTQYRHMI